MKNDDKIWLRGSREYLTWRGDVEVEHFDLEVNIDEHIKQRLVEKLVDADLNDTTEVKHMLNGIFDFKDLQTLFMKQSGWNNIIDELYLDFGNGWHTSFYSNRNESLYSDLVQKTDLKERGS